MEIIDPRIMTLRSREQTMEWLHEKDRCDEICTWVESGGSLIDMCELHGITYSTVMRWIRNRDYPERAKAFDAAVEARKEWLVESLTKELRAISFVDIRKAFDKEGNLLRANDMPDDIAKAIAAVEVDEFGKARIRLWDKLAAIEKLGKNLKMFVDRVEHSGVVTLEDLVAGTITTAPVAAITERPDADKKSDVGETASDGISPGDK
jgi:phage terminase small subunit